MELSLTISALFETYLPQLLGALMTARALAFFGADEKLKKNSLLVAAIAFLVLGFKNIIICVAYFLPELTEGALQVSPLMLEGVSVALISLASLLLIIGGFQFYKALNWIREELAVITCVIAWLFMIRIVFLTPADSHEMLMHIYLITGLVFLGLLIMLPKFKSKAYTLKTTGLWMTVLAFYYFQDMMPWGVSNWLIESLLYLLIVYSIYVTADKQLQNDVKTLADEMRAAQARLPLILQASPFPIMISALKDDRLMLVNEKAATLFNIDMKKLKQFRTEEYYVDPNARKELLRRLSTAPLVENFQALLHKPGSQETFWLEMSARVIDFENEVALYMAFKDITAQKKHEQQLFEQAVLDPLTGCYNRRQFMELAAKEIRRAWRYDTSFCLIMIDIDHFKRVNDTHGHAFGDEVLKVMALTCKQTLRDSDIFARYGGEEFIILLPQTDLPGGMIVAERLRKNIEDLRVPLPDGVPFHFTISLGIVSSGATDDLDELIKRADSALYAAKEGGRNQVRMYGEKESFEETKAKVLEEENASKLQENIVRQAQEALQKVTKGETS